MCQIRGSFAPVDCFTLLLSWGEMFSYVFKLSSVESIVKVECFDMLPDVWNVKYQVVKA
jgi:hypothetical protein